MNFFFPLMEFPINFKTIMKVHLVPSRSWVRVLEHPVPVTVTVTKNLGIKTKKMKQGIGNRDCKSETAFPRSWKSGLYFRDHGNWDCISETVGIGSAFPRSRDRVCIPEITGIGTAF